MRKDRDKMFLFYVQKAIIDFEKRKISRVKFFYIVDKESRKLL